MMNAIEGTKFSARFPLFTSGINGKYICDAEIEGVITIDASYDSNRKHWIYFMVTKSNNGKYVVGKQYKKQGKNFYPAIIGYSYPKDYGTRANAKNMIKQRL